ncbi:MAG: SDR family oxidoreductase [candidate division KSB1 bacterium]|nr:SDR family oxidoreductase [candidate division KSB1 bacterium]
MRILVTGGAGFIGSHVVDAYIEQGHEVHVVDNLSTGRRENLHPRAIFHLLDIRDPAITDFVAEGGFDVLNHHAAQMDVRRSVEDPVYDAEVNAIGTLRLLEGARRGGVRKVIFASTGGAIYGEQDYFPADEEHPLRPVSPYGVTKLIGEKYLHYYHFVHGLSYVVLRYSNVYGPRQSPHGEAGVIAIFAERLLRNQQPVINGDGLQTRDFVYVGDVVRANLMALEYGPTDVFNIGTGIETDVNTIFYKLRELTGSPMPEKHGPAKAGEQRRSVLDIAKARRVLGWEPQVSLDEGLRKTVEYFRARLAEAAS